MLIKCILIEEDLFKGGKGSCAILKRCKLLTSDRTYRELMGHVYTLPTKLLTHFVRSINCIITWFICTCILLEKFLNVRCGHEGCLVALSHIRTSKRSEESQFQRIYGSTLSKYDKKRYSVVC